MQANKGAYINEEGTLVIDMAEADAFWNSLNEKQQYNAMCIMFDPLLAKATLMREALEEIAERDPDNVSAKIARDTLAK
jgi:hypothetical protein